MMWLHRESQAENSEKKQDAQKGSNPPVKFWPRDGNRDLCERLVANNPVYSCSLFEPQEAHPLLQSLQCRHHVISALYICSLFKEAASVLKFKIKLTDEHSLQSNAVLVPNAKRSPDLERNLSWLSRSVVSQFGGYEICVHFLLTVLWLFMLWTSYYEVPRSLLIVLQMVRKVCVVKLSVCVFIRSFEKRKKFSLELQTNVASRKCLTAWAVAQVLVPEKFLLSFAWNKGEVNASQCELKLKFNYIKWFRILAI